RCPAGPPGRRGRTGHRALRGKAALIAEGLLCGVLNGKTAFMIARITGRLEHVDAAAALVDVGGGLWYEVLVPAFDVERLSRRIGQDVALFTLHYIDGDPTRGGQVPRLVGFLSETDREFFKLFTTVKGIGIRKALRSLVRPAADIAAAIQAKDGKVLASLPVILYRKTGDDEKERATDHPLYRTLRFRPNVWMTPIDFYGCGQMHAGLRGNAYNEIVINDGEIHLEPLHPDLVTVEQLDTKRLRYQYTDPALGEQRTLTQDQVVHVRDLAEDAVTGQARAVLAREAIAVSAAAEAFVGGYFKNDATGRLHYLHPGNLSSEKRKEIREMIAENVAGWANRAKTMITSHGVKVEELGKHDDSGFIVDPRNFQVADIARFWRCPLFMIGLEEKSTTWGTGIEAQKQGFVDFTIKPWTDRWAQALTQALLTKE
ncbi:hypothetical protein LCGC14_2723650, partial [marine sediment metagenome]